MTFRDFLDDNAGGLIPLAGGKRTVHAVDGATYRVWFTWLRRSIGVDYHTNQLPRSIRKARAEDARRLHLLAAAASMHAAAAGIRRIAADTRAREAEKLAAGHRFVAGDIVPSWTGEIPAYVAAVKNGRGEVFHRPVGDQRFAIEDGETEPDRSVEHPWVSLYAPRDGGPVQVSCWSTDEGVFEHQPVTVVATAVETEDARNAS